MTDWFACMCEGRFADAWAVSDAVLAAGLWRDQRTLPRHQQAIWDGTPIDGRRVLVRCYHGLGDTIQFVRYMPMLRARARDVILWTQPALLPLLSNAPGIDRLLPLHDDVVDVAYDVDVEIMELPWLFRTTLETIPAVVPYLTPPRAVRTQATGKPRVGLAWRTGGWAPHRAISLRNLAPLWSVPASWHVLHERPGIGIADLASEMMTLDLVITVDSMPAHLAGALGIPVWTLLPADADWRWMQDRDDSPWYPTMRLFRQERAGEWRPVVERVVGELAMRVYGSASQPLSTA